MKRLPRNHTLRDHIDSGVPVCRPHMRALMEERPARQRQADANAMAADELRWEHQLAAANVKWSGR